MSEEKKKFKPSFQRVRYDEERNYIYCGTNTRDTVSFIMPHKKGLCFFVHSKMAKAKTRSHKQITLDVVIPGNYSFEKVTEFIAIHRTMEAGKIGYGLKLVNNKEPNFDYGIARNRELKGGRRKWVQETIRHLKAVQKALLESGMWEKRGMSRWKDVPEGFWDYLPIEEYIKSSGRSYNEWWTTYLTKFTAPMDKAVLLTQPEKSKDKPFNATVTEQYEASLQERWKAEFQSKYPNLTDAALLKIEEKPAYNGRLEKYSAIDEKLQMVQLQKSQHFYFYKKRELVLELIKAGIYPEKLHSIRGWNKLPFADLVQFVMATIPTHKQWGLFLNHIYPNFYKQLLEKHNSWNPIRYGYYSPELIQYLSSMPKQSATVLNDLANLRITVEQLLAFNIKTIPELKRIVEFAKEHQRIQRLKNNMESLNEFYEIPQIKLKNGWVWADHVTFPRLGDLYKCCISGGWYESTIAKGYAHALYRPDKSGDGGALAYLKYGKKGRYWDADNATDGEWHVQEIRSWSNQKVEVEYEEYANTICYKLNQDLPRKHKSVPQVSNEYHLNNFFKDAKDDPLKKKFLDVMEPEYEEMLNLPLLPVARAERARRDNRLEDIFQRAIEDRQAAPVQIIAQEPQDREFAQLLAV